MRVKLKGKTLNIENQSSSISEFYTEWNGYTIEMYPYKHEVKSVWNQKPEIKKGYEVFVITYTGSYIVNGAEYKTKSEALQEAFDNINLDIDELKENYHEYVDENDTEMLEVCEMVKEWW